MQRTTTNHHGTRLGLAAATLSLLTAGCGGGSGSGASVPLTPPAALAYPAPSVDLLAGVVAPPLAPAYAGGAATFTVVPPLPDGLYLNATSGTITGAPTAPAADATYTVTARNAGGTVTAQLELEVHASFDAPTFAYALHADTNEVSMWRQDAGTDTLVPIGRVATGSIPVRAVADPLGRFLYVVCGGEERIAVHRVDRATGRLEPVQLAQADGAAFDAVVDATGRFLYKSNLHVGTMQAYRIDPASGQLVPNGAPVPLPGPSALTLSRNGRHLFAGTLDGQAVMHFVVDTVTGQVEDFIGSGAVEAPVDLVYDDQTGRLHALDFVRDELLTYQVDEQSGRPELLFTTPTGGNPASLVLEGGELLVATRVPAAIERYDLSGPGGVPVLVDATPLAGAPTKLEPFGDGALCALDGAALVARLERAGDGSLVWVDRRPCRTSVTDVVAVEQPRGFELSTSGLFAATGQSLELTGYRTVGDSLEAAGLPVQIGLEPERIAVDPLAGRLFVVERGSDAIACFDVDPQTLALTPAAVVAAGLAPRDAALLPDGRHLVSLDANRVALWRVGAAGELVLVDEHGFLGTTRRLALDPAGRFAFVSVDDAVLGLSLDVRAGTLEPLAAAGLSFSLGSQPTGLVVSPDGRYLVVSLAGSQRLHVAEVDAVDGGLTSRSTLVTGFRSVDPNFDAAGRRLFTVEPDDDTVSLFELSESGVLTLLSRADCGDDASAVAVDRQGGNVWGAALGSDSIEILSLDGDATSIQPQDRVDLGAGSAPRVVAPLVRWSELP